MYTGSLRARAGHCSRGGQSRARWLLTLLSLSLASLLPKDNNGCCLWSRAGGGGGGEGGGGTAGGGQGCGSGAPLWLKTFTPRIKKQTSKKEKKHWHDYEPAAQNYRSDLWTSVDLLNRHCFIADGIPPGETCRLIIIKSPAEVSEDKWRWSNKRHWVTWLFLHCCVEYLSLFLSRSCTDGILESYCERKLTTTSRQLL